MLQSRGLADLGRNKSKEIASIYLATNKNIAIKLLKYHFYGEYIKIRAAACRRLARYLLTKEYKELSASG